MSSRNVRARCNGSDRTPLSRKAIVVIPAQNEAERIGRCIAALAVQRDQVGAPIQTDAFQVLVLANNCTDTTAETVRSLASKIPKPYISSSTP